LYKSLIVAYQVHLTPLLEYMLLLNLYRFKLINYMFSFIMKA